MIVLLPEASPATCGGKAAALGVLLRAGLPVPAGFVLPFDAYRAMLRGLGPVGAVGGPSAAASLGRAIERHPLPITVLEALAHGLDGLGDAPVAVRSSAGNEDTARTSAAGQHLSTLAVQGAAEVTDAIRACWASLHAPGALAYRDASGEGRAQEAVMAVLVQRHVDAEVSGVMFTPDGPGGETRIEASWGLGPSVVGGTVMPDAYRVGADGSVVTDVADKRERLDRRGPRLVTSEVAVPDRQRPTLDEATVVRLARLGERVSAVLGGAQDVEWALVDGQVWLLQARPVTAALPAPTSPRPSRRTSPRTSEDTADTLTGLPGSSGTATGIARVVRGPEDFTDVRAGDILVCPWTDPAWTPLLHMVAGVVTETGGVLSHAAIVAREQGIPAVLGVPGATTRLLDAGHVTIDGAAGTVTMTRPPVHD